MTGTDRLVVVGATGVAGRGICRAALARGWAVTAVARRPEGLAALAAELATTAGDGARLTTRPGSLGDEHAAAALAAALGPGRADAVVVTVNAAVPRRPVLDWPADALARCIADALAPHLAAARHLAPVVRDGGTFVGLGGGMADAVFRGSVPVSMAQAALRMFYRGVSKESDGRIRFAELIVAAMIDVAAARDGADPTWITDDEVGAAACELLENPPERGRPIVTVRSPRAG